LYERSLHSTRDPDTERAVIEDGECLGDSFAALAQSPNNPARPGVRVSAVRLVGSDRALVTFTILSDGRDLLLDQQGGAVKVDGRWLVRRATFCSIAAVAGVICRSP
jgi:hypothetical protein